MDSCKAKITAETQPEATPVRLWHNENARFDIPVSSVLGELLHRFVISKNIAMDTAEQRDGDFQNRHKQVIGRITDLPQVTHEELQLYHAPLYLKKISVTTTKTGIRTAPE
jgi:hypothetical protein